MTLENLKYIKRYRDRHGKVRYYFRKRGVPSITLPGTPLSREFMETYFKAAALPSRSPGPEKKKAPKRDKTGSLEWALTRWYGSSKFQSLEPRTRLHYRQMMERELADYLDLPVTEVEPIVVQSWIDDMSDRPGAAKSFLKRLKTFFRFCAAPTSKILTSNPAQFVEGPSYEKKGFTAWDEADAAAFEAYWPLNSKQRLAYALMSYLGQRVSDAAVLGAAHEIPGGMIRVVQAKIRAGKKRVTVDIPIHPELRRTIAANKASAKTPYLQTDYGTGYSIKGLGNYMSDWAKEAGLSEGKSSHGLRKLAGSRLAEAGCSEKEIMAVLGLSSIKEAALYTAAANQKKMAKEAMKKVRTREVQTKKCLTQVSNSLRRPKKIVKTTSFGEIGRRGGTRTPNQTVMSGRL